MKYTIFAEANIMIYNMIGKLNNLLSTGESIYELTKKLGPKYLHFYIAEVNWMHR